MAVHAMQAHVLLHAQVDACMGEEKAGAQACKRGLCMLFLFLAGTIKFLCNLTCISAQGPRSAAMHVGPQRCASHRLHLSASTQ
eukprot:755737-Pelagomonas_calceolata.AAC.6